LFIKELLTNLGANTAANLLTGSVGDLFTFEYIKLKVCHAILTKQNMQLKWSPLVSVHQINKEGEIVVKPIKLESKKKRDYITREEFEIALRKIATPKKKKKK